MLKTYGFKVYSFHYKGHNALLKLRQVGHFCDTSRFSFTALLGLLFFCHLFTFDWSGNSKVFGNMRPLTSCSLQFLQSWLQMFLCFIYSVHWLRKYLWFMVSNCFDVPKWKMLSLQANHYKNSLKKAKPVQEKLMCVWCVVSGGVIYK